MECAFERIGIWNECHNFVYNSLYIVWRTRHGRSTCCNWHDQLFALITIYTIILDNNFIRICLLHSTHPHSYCYTGYRVVEANFGHFCFFTNISDSVQQRRIMLKRPRSFTKLLGCPRSWNHSLTPFSNKSLVHFFVHPLPWSESECWFNRPKIGQQPMWVTRHDNYFTDAKLLRHSLIDNMTYYVITNAVFF